MQAFLLAVAAVSALGVDVGWQQTDSGEMEYIIQLELHQVKSLKKGDVIEVGVRPDLRNVRRYRIVIGDDKLPRESAPPKLTIAAPGFSAKPLERTGDFSVVVPKDAGGKPIWSEPTIPGGRSSTATYEEPESDLAAAGSADGDRNANESQPGDGTRIDNAGSATAAANDDLRYDSIPPANGAGEVVAADEATSPPARFIAPPSFRDNPYTAPEVPAEQPSANAPAKEVDSGTAGPRYPSLNNSAYGEAPRDVVDPAAASAAGAATGANPQLGKRYSGAEPPTYNPPAYAGSTSFQQPDETVTPPRRPLITEAPQGDTTRVATAFTPANVKSGTDEAAAELQEKGNNESSDAETSEEPAPKPWALFTVTLFALFASLGGNLYLGWMNWDMRQRFRSLIRRMKLGDSMARDSSGGLD